MLNFDYPELLKLLKPYLSPKRNESASFLIWYLANYYRLDDVDAIDSVCDKHGDKGVDGIYVNNGAGTIDILQSKISQKPNATIGDTLLKEFSGTLSQFSSRENLQHLLEGAGDAEVARLIKRLGLLDLIATYEIRGIFISNSVLDINGTTFLNGAKNIKFIGSKELGATFISDKKDSLQIGISEFDISDFNVASYTVDENAKAIIAPVSAKELVKLGGIEDQSLFSLNVRASLGNTQVNKDIINSIRNPLLHKTFPLFHNGITVIAKRVDSNDTKITIEDYFVVNGCQSLNSLYENKDKLTDNLRLLTKFIQVDALSELSEIITAYSNNQNGVKPRDFKSNHPIQTRLQNEFVALYKDEFALEIKRGEPLVGAEVITNESAGLNLIAFDLKEPWTTHRKYQVFDDKYSDIFGRPDVTADRIVLCHVLIKRIEEKKHELKNELIAKYALTNYLILFTVRKIFDADIFGKSVLLNPEKFVRDVNNRAQFIAVIDELLDGLVVDLNIETEELADDFDYRGKLRDKDYVSTLTSGLIASYQKDLKRKKAKSMQECWEQTTI